MKLWSEDNAELTVAITLVLGYCFAISTLFKSATASVPDTPLTATSEVTYYITPFQCDAAEKSFIDFINNQRTEIVGNAYGFTDPIACQALIDRKRAGVWIVLTMDSTEGASPHQAPLVTKLREAGIVVLEGKSPDSHQLLHAKLLIGDRKNVLCGSWNFSLSASHQFNDLIYINNDEKVAGYFLDHWNQIYSYLDAKVKQ